MHQQTNEQRLWISVMGCFMLNSEETFWSALEWDCNIAKCGKSDTFQMHHMSRCPGVQYWNNLKWIAAGVSMVIEKKTVLSMLVSATKVLMFVCQLICVCKVVREVTMKGQTNWMWNHLGPYDTWFIYLSPFWMFELELLRTFPLNFFVCLSFTHYPIKICFV